MNQADIGEDVVLSLYMTHCQPTFGGFSYPIMLESIIENWSEGVLCE